MLNLKFSAKLDASNLLEEEKRRDLIEGEQEESSDSDPIPADLGAIPERKELSNPVNIGSKLLGKGRR